MNIYCNVLEIWSYWILVADLGYVGAGMPTTAEEAAEFAANVADPVRHLNKPTPTASMPGACELVILVN